MLRSYIVIPEDTQVLTVVASSPHYAVSKARRGKAEHTVADQPMAVPVSAVINPTTPVVVIPGQLAFDATA